MTWPRSPADLQSTRVGRSARLLGRRRQVRAAATLSAVGLHLLLLSSLWLHAPNPPAGEASTTPDAMIVGFASFPRPKSAKASAQHEPPQAEAEQAEPPPPSASRPADAQAEQAADQAQAAEIATAMAAFEPASAMGPPDGPCDLAKNLAEDFQASALARQGVSLIPASARSVSNTVLLWNGSWPSHPDQGSALLRGLVAREVGAARPDCRDQLNNGPMFFFAPSVPATLLAVGSGQWRWSDLIR
ncbi:hypothetical protein [Phenylobacterium montanum]|uniref:Uncharacterized protein n=1 Tax=Phenylobacterium montanum TaxID=2823693 RepID=A0A975G2A4_9CAUL|nr:hypothetical protein [Caulobacter sp. S6]QUD89818.1 hypothetical protein KCG34_08095 [Caulobacter sp. S6]